MKKMLLVVLMLLVAGTAYAATSQKTVKCEVKGKTKWVKTASACKDLGGKVVEVKKVTKK
jgi:hypothetical protein